jgi:hypothetical protein
MLSREINFEKAPGMYEDGMFLCFELFVILISYTISAPQYVVPIIRTLGITVSTVVQFERLDPPNITRLILFFLLDMNYT